MTVVRDNKKAPGLEPSDVATPASAPRRDRYIDSLRALALGRVVAYHWFGWAWLPFVFPSMGIMFALAGSLVAASLDRAEHNPWAVLRKRTFRLLPPLWTLGLVLVPLMLLHDGWIAVAGEGGTPLSLQSLSYWVLPINDPASSDWGYAEGLTVPLWYIRAYFWFLLLSPAFLWLFRRWPKRVLALPLVTVTLAGFGVLPVSLDGDSSSRIVATMAMFGACWLLGFAHHDDKIRTLPLAFVLPVSGLLIGLGAYWTATTNGWQIDDSELGEALYCLGFVLLLLRFYPSFEWLRRTPWLDKLITVINARAMTIYLWGNVAILLASLVMSSALMPTVVVGTEWGYKVFGFLVVWLLIGVAVVAVGWVEDVAGGRPARLNPWPQTTGHRRAPSPAPSVTPVPQPQPARAQARASAAASAPAATWRQLVEAGATGAFGMLAVAAAVAAFWIASDDASVAPGGGDSAVTVLREARPAPQPVAVPNVDGLSNGAVDADVPVVYKVGTQLVEQPITTDILQVPVLQPDETAPSGAVVPPPPTTAPTTAPPTTAPPTTAPPTTAPPTTAPPTTAPPTTAPPTTAPPTTAPPTTAPPTTAPVEPSGGPTTGPTGGTVTEPTIGTGSEVDPTVEPTVEPSPPAGTEPTVEQSAEGGGESTEAPATEPSPIAG